jgi:Ca2+-binding RTX toxin-like protein
MVLNYTVGGSLFGGLLSVIVDADEGPSRMTVFWGAGQGSDTVTPDPDFGGLSASKTFFAPAVAAYTARVEADLGGGAKDTDIFYITLRTGAAAGQNVVGNAIAIDLIAGSNFADTLNGNGGNDVLLGGGGNDVLIGGTGDDQLEGGTGNDTLIGGDGDDQLFDLGGGNNRFEGGVGDDFVNGGAGNDFALGGTGDDALAGAAGNDTLSGENGSDTLLGNAGNDSLNGGADADLLIGGAGRDTVVAGTGADTVVGGPGGDSIFLGADRVADRLVFRNAGEFGDIVSGFEVGIDKIYLAFLKTANFVANANPVAGGAGPWLLYETDTGILSVDMLGAGGAAPVQIARFFGNPALAAGDFLFAP